MLCNIKPTIAIIVIAKTVVTQIIKGTVVTEVTFVTEVTIEIVVIKKKTF